MPCSHARCIFLSTLKALPQIVLIDLVPATQYYLSVRSHPSEYNIVWGWRESTDAPSVCTTAATRTDRPHSLARVGITPSSDSVTLTWSPPKPSASSPQSTQQHRRTSVGYRRVGAGGDVGTLGAADAWRWEEVHAKHAGHHAKFQADAESASLVPSQNSTNTNVDTHRQPEQHTLKGLAPGSVYEVVVSNDNGVTVSDPYRMRTSVTGATHTTAFRISEYTFEVDFLQNHDAASPLAMHVNNETRSDCRWLPECVQARTLMPIPIPVI